MAARLLWLAAVCGAVLWFLLSGTPAALMAAAALVLWALVGLIAVLPARRRVRMTLCAPATGIKGASCTLSVQVHSGAALPLPCVRLRLRLDNLLTGQTAVLPLALAVPPRGTGTCQVTLDTALCGVCRLTAERARLYDPLGLVGLSLPAAEPVEFPVEPDILELRLNLPMRTGVSDSSDSYSHQRPGYDFADTFQLREYAPGDSPRQIHWKLSTKLDRLVVRDPGLPLERSVLLLWERRDAGEAPRQASAMAELVISLARELLRQGVRCRVAWNDARQQACALYEPEDENALYDMLPRLLSAAASGAQESVTELYLRQYGRSDGKTVLVSAADCAAPERLCPPESLVSLFCGGQVPPDFPGRAYCIDPDAPALCEIDLY